MNMQMKSCMILIWNCKPQAAKINYFIKSISTFVFGGFNDFDLFSVVLCFLVLGTLSVLVDFLSGRISTIVLSPNVTCFLGDSDLSLVFVDFADSELT